MLTDLRVRLRNRRSRIATCGYRDFLALTKQFFAFLDSNIVLKSVVVELLARNQESVNEVRNAKPDAKVYGETAEEAATIGYLRWLAFSTQDRPDAFHSFALGPADFNEASGVFKDWYVEPLFDYLDETLDDANVILATLIRYKHKVEWYRRADVLKLHEDDTQRGEKNLKRHMFEFLFDQGLPFHVEPSSASGEPDVVSLENSNRLIAEAKVFDGGASPIRKAFYQAYRYCLDYNEPVGYLIVFNVSRKQLRVEVPSDPEGIPRWEYNHKTIFLVVVNLHNEGTASTLGIPETVTILAGELIREVEESPHADS